VKAATNGAFAQRDQQREDKRMTKGQKDRAKQRKRRTSAAQQRATLAAHPVFARLLGIWGAALAGLSILVLPAPLMMKASKGTGLVLLGDFAQLVLAGFAALLLGGGLFVLADQMHRKSLRRADAPSIVSLAARRVRTIDPSRDLGSLRLDDPVETMPFAAAPEPAAPEPALPEPTVAPADIAAPAAVQSAVSMPPPRALDLAEFATLPGRNAVWVEEVAAEAAQQSPQSAPQPAAQNVTAHVTLTAVPDAARPTPRPPVVDPRAAALAQLRATPPQELSLVQMVERFAGALSEHREAASGHAQTPRDLAAREAALAQALRALAALSGDSAAPATEAGEPLRDALTRFQSVRGAA
jgi:hypothetical protein